MAAGDHVLSAGGPRLRHHRHVHQRVGLNASYDVLQPLVYRKRGWGDARIVFFSRIASLVTVIVTLGVTFLIDTLPNALWDAYYFSSGLLSAGVAVAVLAMFWKRVGYAAAFTASLVGGVGTLVFYLFEKYVWIRYPTPHALIDTGKATGHRRCSPSSRLVT